MNKSGITWTMILLNLLRIVIASCLYNIDHRSLPTVCSLRNTISHNNSITHFCIGSQQKSPSCVSSCNLLHQSQSTSFLCSLCQQTVQQPNSHQHFWFCIFELLEAVEAIWVFLLLLKFCCCISWTYYPKQYLNLNRTELSKTVTGLPTLPLEKDKL